MQSLCDSVPVAVIGPAVEEGTSIVRAAARGSFTAGVVSTNDPFQLVRPTVCLQERMGALCSTSVACLLRIYELESQIRYAESVS